MTTELHLIEALSHNVAEPLTIPQKEALQRAVTKIVMLGAQVGVSADQMIQLLECRRATGVPGGSIRRSCLTRARFQMP